MYTECVLILAPITLPLDFGWSHTKLNIFFAITSLLLLPLYVIFDRFSKNYKDRQLLLILLIISFVCCLLMSRYILEITAIKYIVFYTILYMMTNILESVGGALIAKIFTSVENNKVWNSGFIIVIAVTGGRWFGSNLVTLFGYLEYAYYVQDITFMFFAIFFFALSIVCYLNYEKLRVKAISRIKRNQ